MDKLNTRSRTLSVWPFQVTVNVNFGQVKVCDLSYQYYLSQCFISQLIYLHFLEVPVHLKHVALFTHLKINFVKLQLELRKLLGMLVPKMFTTYTGLMLMTSDPAATVIFTV